MNNKCMGCGAILQNIDPKKDGYIKTSNTDLCERCFRIKNYGEYRKSNKTNNDFIPILKNIGASSDLVLLVVDILNINSIINDTFKYLNNPILLVITKRDTIPLSVSDSKLLSIKDKINLNIIDTVLVSSNKNYNFDLLYEKINKYKKSKNVYVVGFTNAGKSTLINKLIYNYTKIDKSILTSIMPSTTLDLIEIELNQELTIIDTPGILDSGSIINYVDMKKLKSIYPKVEIKPYTFQIKTKQSIFIDEIVRIDVEGITSMTFYISNALKVDRVFKESDKLTNLKKFVFDLDRNQDIVISGLGFIKCTNKCHVEIYTFDLVNIFIRDNLI